MFISIKISVSASTVIALMVAFFLPRLLALFIKVITVIPFTWTIIEEVEFEDVFTNLALNRTPFSFLTLIEEVRQLIETIINRRSDL